MAENFNQSGSKSGSSNEQESSRTTPGISNDQSGKSAAADEAGVRKFQQLFALALENAGWGIVIGKTSDRKIEYCNSEFGRMHGYSAEEVRGRGFDDFFVNSLYAYHQNVYEKLLKKGTEQFEIVHRRKDGSIFPVEVQAMVVHDEQGTGYTVAHVFDLSEKKKIETRLIESELTFSSVFDNASIGMTIVAPDGKFIKVNKAYCSILGYTEDELHEMSLKDITHPEDWDYNDEQNKILLARKTETFQMEKRYLHKSGRVVWGLINVSAVHTDQGEPLFMIAQSQDITSRKENERKLSEYTAKLISSNEEKEKYISILAHDLKNPVFAFAGLSEEFVQSFNDYSREEIFEIASVMNDSSKKIKNLLLDLLDWGNAVKSQRAVEKESINLHEETETILSLYKKAALEKKITFINSIPQEAVYLTYRNAAATVLRNLILNALKFSNPGGSIYTDMLFHDGMINMTVRDEGVGISAEKLESIFTLGEVKSTNGTQGESGTGLGLVLCHDLVTKLGGSLVIESAPGRGTTVTFSLPADKSPL